MKGAMLIICIAYSILVSGQTDGKIVPTNITFTSSRIPLKNKYVLIVDTIVDKRVVRLNGPKVDTILEYKTNSLKASELNLGYLHFDTDSFFVISTGTDIDTSIQVYRKVDGKLLLRGRLFTFHKQMNSVSYYDYNAGNKFCVINLISGKIEAYTPPEVHCIFWHRCVESIRLTGNEIQMLYYDKNNRYTTKVYIR